MASVSLPHPLPRPLVVGIVLGLHVAALTLLAGRVQPAVQARPLAMLQVALIEHQPAASAVALPAARPVLPVSRSAPPLSRPSTPARKTAPVQQAPVKQASVPAPAVEHAAPSMPMNTAPSAASDPSAPSAAAAPNAPSISAAATSGARTAAPTAARFDADYLNNPAPAYPALSRRLGEAGEVMLKVLVSAAGMPARIELARSSGSDRLDRAARDAVARWRFIAARQGEHDIEAWVLVPIIFRLQEK